MKHFLNTVMAAKTLAAMIFSGLICAYVAAGYLYAWLIHKGPFNFTIPFIFVLEGVGLSLVIALLYNLLFGEDSASRRRFFPRLVIFAVVLAAALVACLLVFFPFHTDWAKLWLIVAGCVVAVIVVLSVAAELYLRATGKRYTELLKRYQAESHK